MFETLAETYVRLSFKMSAVILSF